MPHSANTKWYQQVHYSFTDKVLLMHSNPFLDGMALGVFMQIVFQTLFCNTVNSNTFGVALSKSSPQAVESWEDA